MPRGQHARWHDQNFSKLYVPRRPKTAAVHTWLMSKLRLALIFGVGIASIDIYIHHFQFQCTREYMNMITNYVISIISLWRTQNGNKQITFGTSLDVFIVSSSSLHWLAIELHSFVARNFNSNLIDTFRSKEVSLRVKVNII